MAPACSVHVEVCVCVCHSQLAGFQDTRLAPICDALSAVLTAPGIQSCVMVSRWREYVTWRQTDRGQHALRNTTTTTTVSAVTYCLITAEQMMQSLRISARQVETLTTVALLVPAPRVHSLLSRGLGPD